MSALRQRLEAALSKPASVTHLDLRGSAADRLDELPADIGRLTALEHLDISHNALRAIPQIEPLANLAVLDARNNQLETMPSFEKLKVLREVYFGHNRLVEIDKYFAWMKQLQRFEAHGNRIRYLPAGGLSPSALIDVQLGDNDLSTECPPKGGFLWTAIRLLLQQKKLTRLGIDSYLLQAPDNYFTAAKKLREVDVYGDDLTADQKSAVQATLPKVTFNFGLAKGDGPRLESLDAPPKKAGKK